MKVTSRKTKHFALQTGYHLATDTPYGFTLWLWHRRGVPAYRFCVGFVFDWPKIVWAHKDWAINEPGYIRGMPVRRQETFSGVWAGREWKIIGWSWFRQWTMRRYD